jgi:mono/diheme cytochrome c family protein
MAEDAERAASISLGRLLVAFAVLSVVLVGVLATAPATTYFAEWRAVQQRYNRLAGRRKIQPIDVRIRQTASPIVDVVDRCGNCHLGAAGVTPIDGDPLFAPHPPIPHEPARFGCTVCHGGQGRAVSARAAHGRVSNWDEPLFPPQFRDAGCGTCHSHVPVPDPELVALGSRLFETRRCTACHTVGGHESVGQVDLSQVGVRGFAEDWQDRHLRAAARSQDARWDGHRGPLEEGEWKGVTAYLKSLIGAPQLMAGKLVVARAGCRGCHRIDGIGGDGPDLSAIGGRNVSDLDVSRVRGGHTLVDWLREVLTDPSRLNPQSRMPAPGLSPLEIDQVITYLLSLRRREVSTSFWPRDRVRAVLLGERDFPLEGRSLFRTFCSACHGPRGAGSTSAGTPLAYAPAIGSESFLAIAGDGFLVRTLRQGRPEHRMPAWGASDGGLKPEEIAAIARYLRSLEPPAPGLEEVTSGDRDLALGRDIFQDKCTPCHGDQGEGTAIGPPLAAVDNPVTSSTSAIYGTLMHGIDGTAMGAFRTLDARTLRSLIGAVQALERRSAVRKGWGPHSGNAERGLKLFEADCASCHDARTEGRRAPAIDDRRFLAVASDSFLTASIVRRHDTTRPPLQRDAEAVADVVSYLRSRGALTDAKEGE